MAHPELIRAFVQTGLQPEDSPVGDSYPTVEQVAIRLRGLGAAIATRDDLEVVLRANGACKGATRDLAEAIMAGLLERQ